MVVETQVTGAVARRTRDPYVATVVSREPSGPTFQSGSSTNVFATIKPRSGSRRSNHGSGRTLPTVSDTRDGLRNFFSLPPQFRCHGARTGPSGSSPGLLPSDNLPETGVLVSPEETGV